MIPRRSEHDIYEIKISFNLPKLSICKPYMNLKLNFCNEIVYIISCIFLLSAGKHSKNVNVVIRKNAVLSPLSMPNPHRFAGTGNLPNLL